MRQAWTDLVEIDRALGEGRLDEARAFASEIARTDRGLGPSRDSEAVTAAAGALSTASTLSHACWLAPSLSAACARCHDRPPRPDIPAIPAARCARVLLHEWR